MLRSPFYDRKAVEIDALREELRGVNKRLAAVEDTLDGLKTGPKQLRLEWEDTLDRLNKIMGRLNARVQQERKAAGGEVTPDSTDPAQLHFDPVVAQRKMRALRKGA